ncbi:MAG TPA: response regulator [Ktedonobacterales bacterium]|jgi:DNA-binding response OmpR family regulator
MPAPQQAGPFPVNILFVDPDRSGVERLVRAVPTVRATAIAATANEAMSAIQAQMPQLVVLELALAGTSGIELIRYLHQQPATQHLLIIVVTTRSSVPDKVAAFQAGADEYLVKPVDPEIFALRVRLLMGFSRLGLH